MARRSVLLGLLVLGLLALAAGVDMIFISADLRVVGIVENAEPQTETVRQVAQPSQYVLEVNGGFSAAHGITAGTPVEFRDIE